MDALQNKIDFVCYISVKNANANGDPLDGNRPRVDNDGYGEISSECIKRKIRNRMQDLGHDIFVQSEDRCTDGCDSLAERMALKLKGITDEEKFRQVACESWMDVRSFGQLFAFKSKDSKGISVGVRGPVSVNLAVSLDPVEVISMGITKSVSGSKEKGETRGSDTMGIRHFVRFGLYQFKGAINVQLAEKTGFTEADAEVVKECLKSLFVNDASAARPEGSMEIVKLFWWKHSCKEGNYSSARVHRLATATRKDASKTPACAEDYEITAETLPGLTLEEYSDLV